MFFILKRKCERATLLIFVCVLINARKIHSVGVFVFLLFRVRYLLTSYNMVNYAVVRGGHMADGITSRLFYESRQ